jgi:cyclic pyranopterin phosphate synthase
MKKLTHLDDQGSLSMVDVGEKGSTSREARAAAMVRLKPETLEAIARHGLSKGDVFAAARVAGILGAKQTSSLVPLTHPLLLTHVDVQFNLDREHSSLEIVSTVRCEGKTGVEIEAMTACAIAAVTVYDMCKSIDREMIIENIRLLHKSGGKSGSWER